MRNKLRESKKRGDASKRVQLRIDEVIVLSDSKGSNEGTSEQEDSAQDAHGSKNTVFSSSTWKKRANFCVKDLKLAPIFLHIPQHNRSSDRKQDGSAERLQSSVLCPQSEGVPHEGKQQQHLKQRKVSCREKLPASVLHSCLEEIQTSNPAFPVRAVFSTLQKKASEGLEASGSTAEDSTNLGSPRFKEKRKRGTETPERVRKRSRSDQGAAGVDPCHAPVHSALKKPPKSSKLSRTHRLRQLSVNPAAGVKNCELNSVINLTGAESQTHKTPYSPQTDFLNEDVLWTDKYSPQHSSEVIGNSGSVKELQSWLQKWKLRADSEERRKMEEKRREENSSDSWDCGDFLGESETEEEPLCNTMLITGPPGVGKTAAVYACSQELGFKVFEVNCSSQRSGHRVLSQLKEATQSHLVETTGKDPLKPTYFSNYSSTPKSDALPGSAVIQKNVTTASKKKAAQSIVRSARKIKPNPAVVTLANYFKMKNKADLLQSADLTPSEKPHCRNSDQASDRRASQNKKTATSLILFEEVDVIFDDDAGFLAAIKTFMTTTKRPVVLTTNDPSFRDRFNCSMEEIVFKAPSEVSVCSWLQLVALAENVQLHLDDVCSLFRLSKGDVRRCLLQLQLWGRSGRGRVSKDSSDGKRDCTDSQLPHQDTGCTPITLGLPATLEKLQNLLQGRSWSDDDTNTILKLLSESWRRAVPLLYTNLELLLPTACKRTSVQLLERCTEQKSEHIHPNIQQQDKEQPKESAVESKTCRFTSRLSRRKHPPVFDITAPPRSTSSPKKAQPEKLKAKVLTSSLDALTDFFDLMSFIDATFPAAAPVVSGSCVPEAFVWTGAEIKDGLLDEMREEGDVSQERPLDIQAAVEGLGCHRCCLKVSEGWSQAQKYRQEVGDAEWEELAEKLTPPVSPERQGLSFSLQPLCKPSVSQRRYKLCKKILGTKPFSLLGDRRAVSVDYMPVLRCICRHQRAQHHTEEPVRCRKYLSRNRLSLSKSITQLLAEDFS